ncbi:RsmE family RNA methyltransferase [Neorickettsia risticii]|uniref:Ribosomal RNA small subunit methyltransferase E n=1 Tax=Neorickettsia risticii (strain Illinois) TaxID=434131 RepID=C6V3R7_NEORI|nr:RsmE family RNA methyltransferase [Neorickettsia risticii]ACT69034.1 conserved hypothetical protein [Neorickettsia risticii str. Illinois]
MRLTRLFLNVETIEKGTKICIDPKKQHYLFSVMRLQKEAQVIVFNGRSGEWIAKVDRNFLVPDIQIRPQTASYPYDIHLCFAVPKHKALKETVRQATELDVTTLRPIYSSRAENKNKDLEKLELWAIEAAQQCRRMSIPILLPPIALREVETYHENVFICDETLSDSVICDIPILSSYTIVIGPEGGFSHEELSLIDKRISLGRTILRCSTAATSAIAQVRSVYSHLTRTPK